ncbi:MAG: MMPL family transporter [Deltaproteobacteria bacterium]|nr:MMPL family transporter [Deltaproteobacteria bacterium]MBW2395015.1 MMPL family transporter [Deltaproteobacteria bacterium]
MLNLLDARIGAALTRWVAAAAARPGRTILVASLVALVAGVWAILFLGVNTDTDALFDRELAFRRADLEIRHDLPARYDNLLVVIDAPTLSHANDLAWELTRRVRNEPETFGGAFAPGGGPFFERHGLLYLDLPELEQLADDLAAIQPLLAAVDRDPSVRGILRLLEVAVRDARDPQRVEPAFQLSELLDEVRLAVDHAERREKIQLGFADRILSPGDGTPRAYVLVRPKIDFTEMLHSESSVRRLLELMNELETGQDGFRLRMTGDRALEVEEFSLIEGQAIKAGAVSLALVAGILWFALRSGRLISSVVLTLIVGLVLTSGFAALAVGHLNIFSIAFTVLFIGLGVDFGTHFTLRYQELLDQGEAHLPALLESARGVGGSLAICALTTAAGFYAFVPTSFFGIAELGLISGTGMLISFVCSLTLLPAILSIRRNGSERSSQSKPRGGMIRLPAWPLQHPRTTCAAAVVLLGFAAHSLPRLEFDANPLNVRDPSAETVKTFLDLVASGDVNPWSIDVLAEDAAQAESLARTLEELPGIKRVITLERYVPEEQEEKLWVLEQMTTFLGLGLAQPLPAPTQQENLAAIGSLRKHLTLLAGRDADPELIFSARALDESLATLVRDKEGRQTAMEALRAGLVAPVQERIERLEAALEAGPVGLDDLPEELSLRMRTEDGRHLVEVHPSGNLNDAEVLRDFVHRVQEVTPRGTGTAVFQIEAAKTILEALREALALAIPAVALILVLMWRNVRDVALVMVPLLSAAVLTAASCVWIGIPINFANVIVLPLLFGIGVDSGIHLVHRYRALGKGTAGLMETSTSRAVFWSALTTAASFASLGFASHRGMATLGQLLTLGVVITLLCNLILLPALLQLTADRERSAAEPEGSL